MKIKPTDIGGVVIVESLPHSDSRGDFIRLFCRNTFGTLGLDTALAQASLSINPKRGTLRGLHFQRPPHDEAKLVSCVAGAIFDVAVDLRIESPTYRRWTAITLEAGAGRSIFIPKGCAHGFQTLASDSIVLYHISTSYHPDAAAGLRFDDPALAIPWPLPPSDISERDRQLPHLSEIGNQAMAHVRQQP